MQELTLQQLNYIDSDDDLLSYIKKQWGLPSGKEITVVSRLKFISKISTHVNDRDIDIYTLRKFFHPVSGKELAYPISAPPPSLQLEGIFIPRSLITQDDFLLNIIPAPTSDLQISLVLVLAPQKERNHEERPNPLKLNVAKIEILEELYDETLVRDSNGNILVKNSLLTYFAMKHRAEIEEEYNRTDQELQQRLKQIQNENTIEIETLEQLKNQSIAERNKLAELEALVAERHKHISELEGEIETMSKTHDDLLAIVKENAVRFRDLGLLDEDEVQSLLSENAEEVLDETFLSFADDLDNDAQRLIQHIQAYLYRKGIRYPRHVLADFFALLQTGDLIILAGDSGSGKTQLVKSFADAIGGKSAIIPVKPNWTGSEDLLGYYNPLEKRFLPSIFTEALLDARKHPDTPYFICLDEMNLAHVEYYFADFLSQLEERDPKNEPIIHLYPEDEADSNWVELNGALKLINDMSQKYGNDQKSFIEMMQDETLNKELCILFGLSEKESLMGYYIHLRSIVRNSIMNTPSKYKFPNNVKIIGAINIDETTNFLSPKILDRAHIIKFENPLSYSGIQIKDEIGDYIDEDIVGSRVKLSTSDIGERSEYPPYDEEDEFCAQILPLAREYLLPLGVEFGFRSMRQGLHYRDIMKRNEESSLIALNNFILHKVLPKLSFDGSRKVSGKEKLELLKDMADSVQALLAELPDDAFHARSYSATQALEDIIIKAKNNDNIVSYWS